MIFLRLFATFFKIGAFTIGGGYAMIPLIQAEVLKNGWMDMQSLVNFIAVSESTPGPFAVNISTYVGAQTGGLFGAVCATLGVVLPSFLIILLVARCYERFQASRIVKGCMAGLRPTVVGLIGATVLSVAKTVFFTNGVSLPSLLSYGAICGAAIFALMMLLQRRRVHPIAIIALSAGLGIASGYAGLAFGL
ncbi:chromate transporter [Feifania hominis]|uniref:Chromate transporter n=1 Tax=Feifania hominis TaxID=2763660 RepID=A0A926HV44_9FIRM|nr:chromate transporter [Feifania hominis]MBC8536211.1 chromate transporter [Feifania hominis]